MAGGILFKCTVCKQSFKKKRDWLEHLLQKSHSDLARKELIKGWRAEELKKRTIVVFSDQPVSKDLQLLELFSKNIYTSIVTDFVWWEEKPGVGFIQFESSKKVNQVFSSVCKRNANRVKLDGKVFQLKPGSSYLDSEQDWDRLLPPDIRTEVGTYIKEEELEVEENVKPVIVKTERENGVTEPFIVKAEREPAPDDQNGSQENTYDGEEGTSSDSESERIEILELEVEKSPEKLSSVLEYIHSEVAIPDKDHKAAFNLLTSLHKIFTRSAGLIAPADFRLWLIRSWALKLRHHNQYNKYPTVLILFREINNASTPGPYQKLEDVNSRIDTVLLTHVQNKDDEGMDTSDASLPAIRFERTEQHAGKSSEELDKLAYLHYLTGEHDKNPLPSFFQITGNNAFAAEAQLWNLARYMCSFDARVEPLLEIVYYWANLNSISFGVQLTKHINNAPEPLALTWLVLYYFYSKLGKKLIPPPYKILGQSHETLYVSENTPDLGFPLDERGEYKSEWLSTLPKRTKKIKNKACPPLGFLSLARNFFFTVGRKFRQGQWILNGRNGNFHDVKTFLNTEIDLAPPKTKHRKKKDAKNYCGNSKEEWLDFQKQLKHDLNFIRIKLGAPLEHYRIRFVHPFNLNWYFRVDGSLFQKMFESGLKLREFLKEYNEGSMELDEVKVKDVVEDLFRI